MSFFSAKDPKIELMRTISVFANSSKKQLEQLSGRMDEITVPAGTELIREGHTNHAFYILVGGMASATYDGQPVAVLVPGDYFGEISMIDRGTASATVTAVEESTLLTLSHAQFRDAIRSDDALDTQVAQTRTERLRRNAESGLPAR